MNVHGFAIRAAAPRGPDLALITAWMASPHVAAAWEQDWPAAAWQAELRRQLAGEHSLPCIAEQQGRPIAYLELYRVAADQLADYYPANEGDMGVHIAIGDPANTGCGIGRALLRWVADGLLSDTRGCNRVVAEPDLRNNRSIRAFLGAGFEHRGLLQLPRKNAALLVRARGPEDQPCLT